MIFEWFLLFIYESITIEHKIKHYLNEKTISLFIRLNFFKRLLFNIRRIMILLRIISFVVIIAAAAAIILLIAGLILFISYIRVSLLLLLRVVLILHLLLLLLAILLAALIRSFRLGLLVVAASLFTV